MKEVELRVGEKSSLHALEWAGGPKLAVAFHGYSNNANLWQPMAALLRDTHTLISVDLPCHGKSAWRAGEVLDRKAFGATLMGLLDAHKADKLDLLGFSLGGRVSLCMAEDHGPRIGRVVLAAPDGLQINRLYQFVTRTAVGKRMFSRFVNQPQGYIRLLDFLLKRGWIDNSRHRFMMHHIGSEPARRFLEGAWPSLREMVADGKKLRNAIRTNKIAVDLFMGRFDTVIPLVHGERFSAAIGSGVRLHTVDRGHHILDSEILQRMANLLRAS